MCGLWSQWYSVVVVRRILVLGLKGLWRELLFILFVVPVFVIEGVVLHLQPTFFRLCTPFPTCSGVNYSDKME